MAEFFSTNLGIFVIVLAQCLAVLAFVMISLLFLVYGDRKIWAAVQMRRGPNVVGAFGLLQTVGALFIFAGVYITRNRERFDRAKPAPASSGQQP